MDAKARRHAVDLLLARYEGAMKLAKERGQEGISDDELLFLTRASFEDAAFLASIDLQAMISQ